MESVKLGAYWGDRAEGIESSARRLHGFLAAIAGIDALLASWVSRRQSGLRLGVGATVGQVEVVLAGGVNRKDVTGEAMPELGFSFGLWNEEKAEGEAAALTGVCGLAAGTSRLANAVSLSIPSALMKDGGGDVSERLIREAVRWWDPEWAWVGTNSLREVQSVSRPLLGLCTYLSETAFGDVAERLGEDFSAARIGGGCLVVLPSERVGALVERFQQAVRSVRWIGE